MDEEKVEEHLHNTDEEKKLKNTYITLTKRKDQEHLHNMDEEKVEEHLYNMDEEKRSRTPT